MIFLIKHFRNLSKIICYYIILLLSIKYIIFYKIPLSLITIVMWFCLSSLFSFFIEKIYFLRMADMSARKAFDLKMEQHPLLRRNALAYLFRGYRQLLLTLTPSCFTPRIPALSSRSIPWSSAIIKSPLSRD